MKVRHWPLAGHEQVADDSQCQPDITFFGEKLDDSFDKALEEDRDQVDLLLVIGTSLKVAPVADILCAYPPFPALR